MHVRKQSPVLVLPNHQHTLNMGKKEVPETSENLHILTLLSARENFMDNNLFLAKCVIFNAILFILFTNLVTYY
jgi:hypothetical protein